MTARLQKTSRVHIALWGVDQVVEWLQDQFSDQVINVFREQEIRGSDLLTMTQSDIQYELGIARFSTRRRLWMCLLTLRSLSSFANEKKGVLLQKNSLRESKSDFESPDARLACQLQECELDQMDTVLNDQAAALVLQNQFNRLMLIEEEDRKMVLRQEGKEVLSIEPEVREPERVIPTREMLPMITHHGEVKECVVCLGPRKNMFQAPCGHHYCRTDMTTLFSNASRDSTLIPLKCCKLPFGNDIEWAHRLLDSGTTRLFEVRFQEVTAKHGMYCTRSACSSFIDLDLVPLTHMSLNGEFSCSECKLELCSLCKSTAHPKLSCADAKVALESTNDKAFEALREAEGYTGCPKCGRIVELVFGCNHITCVCKGEFCYQCGTRWKNCDCPTWNEARLLLRAENNVPQAIQGPARAVAVQGHANRMRGQFARQEECDHRTRTRTDSYQNRRRKPECFSCLRRLNIFGYVCDGCGLKYCIGCHLNR